MPKFRRSALPAVLVAIFFCAFNLTAAIAASDVARSNRSASSTSTCRSQSINYITQTLAQQCLATTWAKPTSETQAPKGSVGVNGNATISDPSAIVQTTRLEASDPATATASRAVTPQTETVTTNLAAAARANVPAQPTADSEQEPETDPFSDKGNFLSFEEWKKQMLEKAGQSPDHVGAERKGIGAGQNRRRPGDISSALDTLGDDSEIELDFSGFVSTDEAPRPPNVRKKESDTVTEALKKDRGDSDGHVTRKSKDAGTTCKERFNYASFDCAATVMKTNTESKGSTSVLVENKDSYMLNPCKAKNKFFIIELCNDILIDTVVLANFEFFSSTFRTFRVSVADRYPVKAEKWTDLGTFEARNTREIQPFLVENGLIYARYLRLEFLTHYGVEYYCPVSLLRIHGKTMFDDWNEIRNDRGDEDAVEDVSEAEGDERFEMPEELEAAKNIEETPNPETVRAESDIQDSQLASPTVQVSTQHNKTLIIDNATGPNSLPIRKDLSIWVSYHSPLYESQDLATKFCNSSATVCHLEHSERIRKPLAAAASSKESSQAISHATTVSSRSEESEPSVIPSQPTSTVVNSTALPNQTGYTVLSQNSTQSSSSSKPITTQLSYIKSSSSASQTPTKTTSTNPPAPTPSTQESFFKSIAKRLQHLEQNSTLSLQYIEEQSRLLREAFVKVEKRQLSKTSNFLENLNTTVLSELHDFRALYDQMWQSTVLELSSQRQASQQEIVALSARLSILADETLFHKRMVVIQFFLILVCLVLIMFSRMSSSPGAAAYADLQSAVRDVVSKPSVHLSRYLNLESPPGSPDTRPVSRYGFFSGRTLVPSAEGHARSTSSESTAIDDRAKTNGAAEALSPLSADEGARSPTDEEEHDPAESPREEGRSQSPEVQQAALLRSWSNPEMESQLKVMDTEDEFTGHVDTVSDQTATRGSGAFAQASDEAPENLHSQPIPSIDLTPDSPDRTSEEVMHHAQRHGVVA